jgi:hypothetical protein
MRMPGSSIGKLGWQVLVELLIAKVAVTAAAMVVAIST